MLCCAVLWQASDRRALRLTGLAFIFRQFQSRREWVALAHRNDSGEGDSGHADRHREDLVNADKDKARTGAGVGGATCVLDWVQNRN